MARFVVRVLVAATAAVMATGFLNWRAGLLVGSLVALSYVLLAYVAPRVSSPVGRGRMLRTLERHGYYVFPDRMSRHLVLGPSGVYLFDTRVWRHAISQGRNGWQIGTLPAGRVIDKLSNDAARFDRMLGLPELFGGDVLVLPVIAVAGRLPASAMRAEGAVIARPRGALRHILERPETLTDAEIEDLADAVHGRLLR